MISIFIVDDHPVVATGLAALLERYSGLKVIGVELDGEKAVERILEEKPKVVLQDMNLGEISGTQVMDQVFKSKSSSRFLIFTVLPPNGYSLKLIRNGASGFLNKNAPIEELVSAIRSIARGQTYINRELKMLMAEQSEKKKKAGVDALSKREYEIFLRVAKGKRQQEIQSELNIGQSTVSTYIARIHRKLGTQNVTDLARMATQEALI